MSTEEQTASEPRGYDPHGVVDKWLPVWDRLRVFEARDDDTRERRYIVDMFPYPSGDLHMGHAEAFSIGDAVARFARAKGHDVQIGRASCRERVLCVV